MLGGYCCKSPEENEWNNIDPPVDPRFEGCDGSFLSLNSMCCKNNEYQKCAHPEGCANNKGNVILSC